MAHAFLQSVDINKDENIHKYQSFCGITDRQTDKIFTE